MRTTCFSDSGCLPTPLLPRQRHPPRRNMGPGTDPPEGTWDPAARQEVTSYEDPPTCGQNNWHTLLETLPCHKLFLFLVPDPVQDVSVSTQGPESLLVSWIPADTAVKNITHYVFTVTDKDDSNTCIRTVVIPMDSSLPVSMTNSSPLVHKTNWRVDNKWQVQ